MTFSPIRCFLFIHFLRIGIALAVFFLLLPPIAPAQSPVYFTIGEESLSNVEVYSLLQGDSGRFYAATNQGLFHYHHGDFHLIEGPPEQIGKSLFNLCKGPEGQIYCHNLSGQIFRLSHHRLSLFKTLDKQLSSPNYILNSLPNGDLLFASVNLLLVHPDGSHEILDLPGNKGGISSLAVGTDGEIVVTTLGNKGFWVGEPKSLQYQPFKYQYAPGEPLLRITPFELDGKWMAIDASGNLFSPDPDCKVAHYTPAPAQRTFSSPSGSVFSMQRDQGVKEWTLSAGQFRSTESFFNDYFISAMCKGDDGSILLGTFGNGVLVIPSPFAIDWTTPGANSKVSGICDNGVDTLFAVNRRGNLFSYAMGKWDTLCNFPERTLERIIFLKGWGMGPCEANRDLLVNGALPVSSIKDAAIWMDGSILIASSYGIHLFGGKQSVVNPVFKERAVSVTSDLVRGKYYFATISQVWEGREDGSLTELKKDGQSIRASCLEMAGDTLLLGTESHGLLAWDGISIQPLFPSESAASISSIFRIQAAGDLIYIAHQEGFDVIRRKSGVRESLLTGTGIPKGAVKDFAVLGNHFWLVTSKGLVQLKQNHTTRKFLQHWWSVDSICAGGKCAVMKNGQENGPVWGYQQNNIEVHFTFSGIIPERETQIGYRLEGADSAWQYLPATASKVDFRSLEPGEYRLQFRLKLAMGNHEDYWITWEILPPFWRTWWFQLLVAVVLIAGVIGIFTQRIRQLRVKNAEDVARREMEKNVLESKLKAIRSQMNPHFIFNSLNSIQDLILQQDTDNAYDYVVYFADLVRSTLKFSEKEFLPLSEEIEFLEVYLSLEKLRFKDDFTYSITVEGDSDILLPSLLVQPFVENALQHGLLHKKGPKDLRIVFRVGDLLEIILTDNGIGREAANKIKERQGGGHPSFSLSAIRQRMEILEGMAGIEAQYEFVDLAEDGVAKGTVAIIRLSYRKVF